MIHIHAETKSTIMTNEHASLEKYTSQTLFEMVAKGLCVRGGLETEQRLQHIDTQHFFPHSAGLLNQGPWGPSSLLGLVLTASNCNKLTPNHWTSGRIGLYHCLTSTCFLWASHLHPNQPVHGQGYILMSSTGCTCSLIDGWVRGQCYNYSVSVLMNHH